MAEPRPPAIFINSDVFLCSECKAQGEAAVTQIMVVGRTDDVPVLYIWMMSVVYLLFSAVYNNNQSANTRHGHSSPAFERVLHWSGALALVAAAIALLTGCVIASMPTLTASTAFISAAAIARLLVDVTRLSRYVRGLMTGSGSYGRLPYPIQETERW